MDTCGEWLLNLAIVKTPHVSGVGSQEHNELSLMTSAWLRSRCTRKGMKSAREVYLRPGYVADAVAVASIQSRFERHYNADSVNVSRGSVLLEDHVFVFEAKISRADFLSTFGKNYGIKGREEAAGNLHFVVTPRGLINPNDVPEPWGLLEKSGSGLREIRKPMFKSIDESWLHWVGYRLLWKGSHHRDDE